MPKLEDRLQVIGRQVHNFIDGDNGRRFGLVVVGLIVGAFFLTRPAPPPSSSIDGVYSNPCCSPVTLPHGVLIAQHLQVPFQLVSMKYGLTAHIKPSVQVGSGGSLIAKSDGGAGEILFDDDHQGFVLPDGHDAEYRFRRARQ